MKNSRTMYMLYCSETVKTEGLVILQHIQQQCRTQEQHQPSCLHKRFHLLSNKTQTCIWAPGSEKKSSHTFAIRDNGRHEGSSPVGNLDGEIPLLVLELVETDRPPGSIGAAGQCKAQQQRHRDQCSSGHYWFLAQGRCAALLMADWSTGLHVAE